MENAINARYTALSTDSCCLSCGRALSFGEPQPGEVCIDLGSGRGSDVIRMAMEVGERGRAYGIDGADGMLEVARRTAERMGVDNCSFICADLDNIDLPDCSADLIISNCTINHAPDQAAVWREIHRLLRPGGRFAVSDIYALEPVPETYRNDPLAVAECWAGAVTRQEYFENIEAAGLKGVEFAEESAPYEKGKISVASFTVRGRRPLACCCS